MGDADDVREILNTVYGADVCYLMSDVQSASDDAIPTGIVAFDQGLLGIGGFPRGHFLELSGEDKAGKTTLLLHMIAGCQNEGLVPLVIDSKGAVTSDTVRAARIGVDLEECIVVPVDSSEEALQKTREGLKKIRAKGHDVAFFWDDMGLTPTESELKPGKDQKTKQDVEKVGAKAKSMWRFCRTLAGDCHKAGAPMVVVNQLQAYIATGWLAKFAPKETTSSGGGLRYAARIRIMLRKGPQIKVGTRSVGQIVYADTQANAFFPPFQRVRLYLNFRNGYDSDKSSIVTAEYLKLVTKSRGKYKLKGSKRGSKGVPLKDIDAKFIWELEERMWPWMGDDYEVADDDAEVEDEDLDEEESEEDEFAEGYVSED